jgi:hypothetical protein
MSNWRVCVIVQVIGDDLRVVLLTKALNEAMISEPFTIVGAAPAVRGNPYLVYGDAVRAFLGLEVDSGWDECSIVVAKITSGEIGRGFDYGDD